MFTFIFMFTYIFLIPGTPTFPLDWTVRRPLHPTTPPGCRRWPRRPIRPEACTTTVAWQGLREGEENIWVFP